jgi:multiple sugar transport system substrate-binding protein
MTNNAGYLDLSWTEVTVKQPEFRESLQFMHDLIHVDGSTSTFQIPAGQDENFSAGLLAMFTSGHWIVPTLRSSDIERIGVVKVPRKKSGSTVFGIGAIGITSLSENPDLAWEFLQEMVGEEFQQELAASAVSVPAWQRYATTEEWTAWPANSKVFYETAEDAIAVPSPENYAELDGIFMRNLEAFLNNQQDLDTAIDNMDKEMTRAMKRASQ